MMLAPHEDRILKILLRGGVRPFEVIQGNIKSRGSLHVIIHSLKKKLSKHGVKIKSEYCVGYSMSNDHISIAKKLPVERKYKI